MRRWEAAIPAVSIARAVSVMPPPPSLARAEDGGARGDAILTVLVLEAVVVVALDVLEKFRALRRRHRAVVIVLLYQVHRYSKYLLIYSIPHQKYDTFHLIPSVIPPHSTIEELVQLAYFYEETPR
jgi:hypothetical protein